MICYKELYGADADGNRGQWVLECENFRDNMDTEVQALVFAFNLAATRTDVDRATLRELLLEDIKEQL
jgi:hypothetical protein